MKRSSRTRKWLLLVALSLTLGACASSSSGGGSERPIGDPDVLLRTEFERSPGSRTAYELIQALRPQWLITRGITNLRQAAGEEDIVVYMDNARMGYREALRRLPLGNIEYLQFFNASEATQRWGGGHIHGAILVSTAQRR